MICDRICGHPDASLCVLLDFLLFFSGNRAIHGHARGGTFFFDLPTPIFLTPISWGKIPKRQASLQRLIFA